MRLYFHHVGEEGSKRDFPRTVWNEVSIQTVEQNIDSDDSFRGPLLRDLNAKFPSGRFNCWGVPLGASSILRNLRSGDTVLLVETVRLAGSVPALCQVAVFQSQAFPKLSKALWGEGHFPYVFFFSTERLSLTWQELKEHLGYASKFDPRGKFYSVKEDKPERFGSQAEFVDWLRTNRSDRR